ncbi:hypothetical protein VNI00_013840 [Paramarasmius palmivorus]|uniref:Uncharacterized protein n=1 Tax=Paramarasmius palmivorus TaxID=297713 RepID=A0AAW0C0C3_9AGAR
MPTKKNDDRRKWWIMLGEEDFEEKRGSVSGMGKWKGTALERFKQDFLELKKRATAHCESRKLSGQSPNIVVSVLSYQLDIVLGYLLHHIAPRRVVQRLLRCFQRWYLELTAALDWFELFRPLMEGKAVPPQTGKTDRVGTFTTNDIDRQHLRSAGIPVWHIQPGVEQPFTGFFAEVAVQTPEDMGIELEIGREAQCVFEGGSDTVARAIAIENYLRSLTKPGNPFAASFADPVSSAVSSTPGSTSITLPGHPVSERGTSAAGSTSSALPARPLATKDKRHQPYKKGSQVDKNTKQVNRDKFAEITKPYSPPTPPFWITALAGIDRKNKLRKEEITNSGYVFPDPGMFVVAPEEKLERYIRAWLDLREVLTFRVMMRPACLASVAWSPQQWRLLLALTDGHPSASGTFMDQSRKSVDCLLGECLTFYGIS